MTDRKLLFVVALSALICSVSASYMIYSNVVTENVSAFTLTSNNPTPHLYENVTFTATLGPSAGAGKTVYFYQSGVQIGTNTTDVNGIAVLEVNMTSTGSIDFKAGNLVP